jgi:hypothetical protein
MIKTWQQRCEEHPDHKGIVTEQMICDRMQEEIDELRQALAQPEQEPVCFLRETAWSYEIAPWDDPNGFPVYTAPSKQEYQYEVVAEHANGTYTTKRIPKRDSSSWVGLTADEIWKCNKAEAGSAVEFHICSAHQNVLDFAEALEAKLKEKNLCG